MTDDVLVISTDSVHAVFVKSSFSTSNQGVLLISMSQLLLLNNFFPLGGMKGVFFIFHGA